jgi:hypothetical protein
MKKVKLIARPDTWFKEGTEVYDYDADYGDKERITLEAFEEWKKSGFICARGIRIAQTDNECRVFGLDMGEEYIDGEACHIDEFDVEIVEE